MNKDDFWSVDRLLPRVHGSFSENKNAGVPLATLENAVPDKEFGEMIRPIGSRIIRFYRLTQPTFPKNDLILENRKETSAPNFVSCSLFAPTMISLNSAQRDYFYYFCQTVEKKQKVQTSFAYIRLYLCRILRKIELLCELPDEFFWLWEHYREEFPLADKLFSDFVSDFCFYKKIIPPYEMLEPILTKKNFTVRPFLADPFIFDYLFASDRKPNANQTNYLLRTLTAQSFRNSKAYHTAPLYAATCEESIRRAFEDGLFNRKDLNENLFSIRIPSEVHTVRAMFQGLPREEIPVAEINLCYVPLLHDVNIRDRCDELIRYLENRVRSILKMKNALSRIHISEEHKAFLEGILLEFAHLTPRTDEAPPAYDAKPVVKRELEIDPAQANKIEETSWIITQKLTEDYTEEQGESVTVGGEPELLENNYGTDLKKVERPLAEAAENEFWEFAAMLSQEEDTFLSICLHRGKDAARRYAVSLGAFYEAMVANCNEKAMDSVGDAVMEPNGEIFEEYRKDLCEVFPEPKGEA